MPGIYGASTADPAAHRLETAFHARWSGAASAHGVGGGMLGGHAHGSRSAVQAVPRGGVVAVDGEPGAYAGGAVGAASEPGSDEDLSPELPASIAVLRPDGSIVLAADWSGTFPLYYHHHAGSLLFSSLLGPLRAAVGARGDPVGMIEFLRDGALPTSRSQVLGVARLLPGQVAIFEPARDRLRVLETSRAWTGETARPPEAERVADLVVDAAERWLDAGRSPALMMSAGWDSRTLLAASRGRTSGLLCYSHGDPESRELRIARLLASVAGADFHAEPLRPSMLDPETLVEDARRVELAIFPHWLTAGRTLQGAGRDVVAAGVFGEVLGGHYGAALGLSAWRRQVRAVIGGRDGLTEAAVRGHLAPPSVSRPWYLREDFWADSGDVGASYKADVHSALDRLVRRGVEDPHRLFEAYVSETRGSQYINGQLRSCRAHVDVALPFAGRRLLLAASRIPIGTKLHNRLSRRLLRVLAPELMDQPLAATLLPASAPAALQEASRTLRWVLEEGQWWAHRASRGAVPRPRWGWVDFEFLRYGGLQAIVEDLRCDCWDRDRLLSVARDLSGPTGRRNLHPYLDQIGKILTVDLILR